MGARMRQAERDRTADPLGSSRDHGNLVQQAKARVIDWFRIHSAHLWSPLAGAAKRTLLRPSPLISNPSILVFEISCGVARGNQKNENAGLSIDLYSKLSGLRNIQKSLAAA
jgi:hypothetical protein